MVIGSNAQWLEKASATSTFIKGMKEDLRLGCKLVTLIPALRKTAEPILPEVISKHTKDKKIYLEEPSWIAHQGQGMPEQATVFCD